MRRHSLLRRVLLGLLGVAVLTLVATLGLLWVQYKSATGVVADSDLSEHLETIQRYLVLDPQGRPSEILPAELKQAFNDKHFFTVSDQH